MQNSRSINPFLRGLALASCLLAANPTFSANVDEDRALKAAGETDWIMHGRSYKEQRFSPLTQINDENVSNLGVAWASEIPSVDDGLAATPLVIDGVIYMTSSFANTWAVDARNGEILWEYNPVVQYHGSWSTSWSARVNRGAAAWKGNIYVATPDCRLVALDAKTGEEVWSILTCDASAQYGITGAPRVYKDIVIIGNGVADYGARGYVTAYRAKDGKQLWRFYTVPGDPSKGFENPILEMAAKTWSGENFWESGGGTAWDAIVFDPDLNQIYIGTDSALPWNYEVRSPGGGDNLFLNSIIALDADTGDYKWHYQTVPKDAWDFNAASHIIQAEIELFGEQRQVLMQAPKNGFFYVLDRKTGELLAAEKYVPANWAEKIDIKTGRPVENEKARYYKNDKKKADVSPMVLGGHNWHPMSFHPGTGLVYIPAHEFTTSYRVAETEGGIGGTLFDYYGKGDVDLVRNEIKAGRIGKIGRLLGWDPVNMEVKWRVDHEIALNGGVLSTAGNLVFQGTGSGEFRAYTADEGKQLWGIDVGRSVQAPPVTYMLDGDQYVLAPIGGGGIARQMVPLYGNKGKDTGQPSMLVAFKLSADGKIPEHHPIVREVPKPPMEPKKDLVASGAALFEEMSCGLCHGSGAIGPRIGASTPDLRYAAPETHQNFKEIVLKGSRAITGMLPHEDFLSEAQADAIHSFVLSRQWELYNAQN